MSLNQRFTSVFYWWCHLVITYFKNCQYLVQQLIFWQSLVLFNSD